MDHFAGPILSYKILKELLIFSSNSFEEKISKIYNNFFSFLLRDFEELNQKKNSNKFYIKIN